MSEDTSLIFEAIQDFLGLPNEFYDLEDILIDNFKSDEHRLLILESIYNFVHLFQMFKSVKPLMKSIYKCIQKTLDHEVEKIEEYKELLLRTTLFRLLEEFMSYKKISQKEKVLEYLLESLERLQLQPLIINLGLMVKPIYEDLEYVNKIESLEAVEISYVIGDNEELDIKEKMDKWISEQKLDLDRQEELKRELIKIFKELTNTHKISEGTKQFDRLQSEVVEMMTLKFTVLSLMESVEDFDDVAPIPIK